MKFTPRSSRSGVVSGTDRVLPDLKTQRLILLCQRRPSFHAKVSGTKPSSLASVSKKKSGLSKRILVAARGNHVREQLHGCAAVLEARGATSSGTLETWVCSATRKPSSAICILCATSWLLEVTGAAQLGHSFNRGARTLRIF